MGMFNYVVVPKEFLPEEYRCVEEWQTKDVLDPWLNTFEILDNKQLILNSPVVIEAPNTPFGFIVDKENSEITEVDYTGEMRIYSVYKNNFYEVKLLFYKGTLTEVLPIDIYLLGRPKG